MCRGNAYWEKPISNWGVLGHVMCDLILSLMFPAVEKFMIFLMCIINNFVILSLQRKVNKVNKRYYL